MIKLATCNGIPYKGKMTMDIAKYYCPYIPICLEKEKEEMCIPQIPLEEEEKNFYAETELAYLLSEDVMNEIYKEEIFQQLEKNIQEEERLVVISRFVQEMCGYYKIAQADYVMWQHYYNYLREEEELVESKAQTQLNEEMKQYVEEMKEEDRPPAIRFIGDEMALWDAIEKHQKA